MKSKLFSLVFLSFSFVLFSQTLNEKKVILKETNISKLLDISKNTKAKAIKDKKLALSLAKIKGWEVFIKDSKGAFSELMSVNSLKEPIYYTTYNYGAGLTARTNHLYSNGSLGLNVEGQNMIAGEWDGGGVRLTHELFEGRVTQMDVTSGTHYHSTHVAGTIMGSDQVQGGNARGMAFKANLIAYEWNSDQSEVAQAAANGLLISNHSYGFNPASLSLHQFGKYESDANAFDDIMYNAPYYLFVAAAGNARNDGINSNDGGYDLLSGHSCSKNSMVVAAVNELTNYTGASSVIMSSFSSWGPTDDGRIKPDISAKGVDTFSASDNFDSDYITISGTSMASPSVTGTLLLMQQYYNQQNGVFMHSSTLRGLALHTADEAGNNPGPDYEFGWGLINAKKAVEVIRDNGLLSYISEETLSQGDSYSISFDALGSEPLKASICWTDPAGNIITNTIEDFYSPALVNDLDVRITKNGTTYFPWKLDPNNLSAAATKADNVVDNIELVEIDNPVGTYTLTVTHKGTLQSGSQNFSVIVSGISFNDFYVTSNNTNQDICEGDNSTQYNLSLTTISGFSDNVTFSAINLPASVGATFSPSSMNSEGNFDLNLANLSGLSAGIYPFTVHAQSNTDSADLELELKILNSNFSSVVLNSPTNNETSIDVGAIFTWSEDLNAQQYYIQIATDSTFTNIIEDGYVSSSSFQATALVYNTNYYWRVQPLNSCYDGSFSSGYNFTTVCVGPTDVLTSNILLDSVVVSWTENSGGSNWELEIVEVGNSPTGIGMPINTNPYAVTGLNSLTDYIVYVRSDCGNGNFSEWGISLPFTTAADFCSGDHFYDTGGVSGNYSNNENNIITIAPSTGNSSVYVQFNSFSLESNFDYLSVYNGSDTNSPLLGTFSGSTIPGPFTSDNPNGTLTFRFTSDSSVTYEGWDASVTCFNLTCPQPSTLVSTNITTSSVDLSWIAGYEETNWEIEYGETGFTQGTGTIVQTNTNPFTLTGLNSATTYDVYLRANCGTNPGDDDSFWVMTSLTTVADFCSGDHFYDTGGVSGSYSNNENNITTIAPSTGNNAVHIQFNSFSLESGFDYLSVYNGSDTNAPLLGTFSGSTIPGPFTSNNPNGTLTFRFTSDGSATSGGWDASVTCFNLTCPQPSNLVTTNITENNVELSWTNGGSETNWELEYGVAGFTQGTGTLVQINNNSYNLVGLNPNTTYDMYLRANCGTNPGDDDSFWVMTSFTTLVSCPSVSNLYTTNTTYNSTVANWTNGGSETSWEIEYGISGFTQGTGTLVQTNTNPYTITGLSPNTSYQYYVKANCGVNIGDDDSNWVGPYYFYTSNLPYPTNLTTTLNQANGEVTLNWNSSNFNTLDFVTYYIYRDGALIATEATTTYIDQLPTYGNYSYFIRAHYDEGDSYQSNSSYVSWISCPIPTNLTTSNEALTSVDLSWDAGNIETNWEVEYGDAGFTQGTGTVVQTTTNPFTLTGLNASTNYDVYLRANCGANPGDDDSLWVGPINFSTLCDVFVTPYLNNLETFNGDYEIENCWSATPLVSSYNYSWNISSYGSTPSSSTGPSQANSGSTFFFTEASNGNLGDVAELTTPVFDISSLTVPQLSFYYHMYGYEMGSLHIDIFNNGTWTNDEIIIDGQQQTSGSDAWLMQTLVLSNYTGQIQVRFRGVRGSSYSSDISIDDIQISEAPTCPQPSNLVTINVTASSIDLSWTAGYTESNWEIEYGDAGFTQGTGTIVQTNTNPFTLTGLNPATTYDVYLRANCGTNPGDDDSLWVMTNFTTLVSCPQPSNLVSTNITASSVDLSWTAGYTETNWEIEYGETGFTQGTGTIIQTTTNPFTLTGLNQATTYDVYLRANCGTNPGDDDSNWVGPLNLSTPCDTIVAPYVEDFEDGGLLNSCWIQETNDDFNWSVHFGGTDSSGTGPNAAYSGTYYLYTETSSPVGNGYSASIYSPQIDLSTLTLGELNFAYHMYGNGMDSDGNIDVAISTDGGVNFISIFNEVGNHGNQWNIASILLTSYTGVVQFKITGTVSTNGISYENDFAIDSFSVNEVPDTGSIDELSQFNFKYFPNPFEKALNLSANENFTSIKVFSLLGKELITINPENQSQLSIDMSSLSIGTYFMKVEIHGKTSSMKIIKK